MDQLANVILAIDKIHTALQIVLNYFLIHIQI